MFTCALVFIVFLPIALLPLVIDLFFHSDELSNMGISLEPKEIVR